MSKISDFYKDKIIFLTGGTGFLGKLILQKFLSSTRAKKIYIIIRPKRGISVEQRLQELLQQQIFLNVKHKVNIITALPGDLTELNLGLVSKDINNLNENANIIIHCGAHLNFVSDLRESVFSNVRSTREILKIAKNCKKLVAFLYVSTAYSNCPNKVIKEEFFESPIKPNLLIKISEALSKDLLKIISPGLLGAWPNPYVFTKAVAEHLIKEDKGTLPIVIFRPSIITSTVKEPIKSWTDTLYGPNGIILNTNLGTLRTVRIKPSTKVDFVPADMVVNAILSIIWEIDQRWQQRFVKINYKDPVFNFSGLNSEIYLTNKDVLDLTMIPMKSSIWYPMILMTDSQILHWVFNFIFHTIPNLIMDYIAVKLGKEPRALKLSEKITKACEVLAYFMTQEWTILNDNIVVLWDKLSDVDREIFNFNVKTLNGKEYYRSLAIGIKVFIAKENMAEIRQHEKKLACLKLLHFSILGVLVVLLFFLIAFLLKYTFY